MNKRLKLALAALLGFSAACSSVKNAPAKGETEVANDADTTVMETPRMVVMYGVRIPRPQQPEGTMSVPLKDSIASDNSTSPALDPVAEEPVEE